MTGLRKLIAISMTVLMLLPQFATSVSAQPTNGGSTVTALSVASIPDGFVRLKNKWQSNYLYEASDGKVLYGFTSVTDQTSEWLIEAAPGNSGNVRIKNRASGHYITIAQATSASVALTSEAITNSTTNDQWIMEEASNRTGYNTFRSAASPDSSNYIHVENQKGFAQYGSINSTFESPQWALEPITELAPVRILSKRGTANYLYEDSDGIIQYGNVPVSDMRSHWIVISDAVDPTKVELKNRASGHYITQGADASAGLHGLALDNQNLAKSQWTMTSNSTDTGWLNFNNVSVPSNILLNSVPDNVPDDTKARSNTWRDANSDDSKWKFQAAADVNATRIVNFTTQSIGSAYLSEDNAGNVKVGALEAANNAYLWLSEDYNGKKRIKNVATGHYISMKNAVNDTDPLQSLDLSTSAATDQWTVAISTIYDDYKTIQSATDEFKFINVQPQGIYAQSSSVLQDSPNPGQWLFEDPAVIPGAQQYVQIQSKWNNLYFYEDANGNLKYGNAKPDDQKSQWLIIKYEGRKLIQNRLSGHYLNMVNMSNGHIQVTQFSDQNLLDMTTAQKNKVKWVVENNGGTVNIHNVKDTNSDPDNQKFIHIQNSTKYAEYGKIDRNWTSAQLTFVTVPEAEPTKIHIKNKVTGAYLYEDNGLVKHGSLSVSDTVYQWVLENAGNNKVRIKNISTNHYINLHALTGDAFVDPVSVEDVSSYNPNTSTWFIDNVGAYKAIRVEWSGQKLYATDPTGLLYADYKHFDNDASLPPNSKDNALWTFEDVPVPVASTNIRIKNKVTGAYLYENNGLVKNGSLSVSDTTYQWFLEPAGNNVRIKNVSTGHYINLHASSGNSNLDPVSVEDANPQDTNIFILGDAAGGYKTFQSSWSGSRLYATSSTGNLYNDYIHYQSSDPAVVATSEWILEDVPIAPASPNILIKNKVNGAYLYEDNGLVKNGSLSVSDTTYQWFLEPAGNNVRIKNVSTGHYINLHDNNNSNTDPVSVESVDPNITNTWGLVDAGDGSKYIFNVLWSGSHLYATTATGNLYNDYNHFDNVSDPNSRETTKWIIENAPSTPPVSAIPAGNIQIKNGSKFLYESPTGIVLFGNVASDNGYSNWVVENGPDAGIKRIKNRETGHYMAMNTDYHYIQSISSTSATDVKTQWVMDVTGTTFTIRSNNDSYNDEYVNVQNDAGYAERGLYPVSFGSLQWSAVTAPDVTHTPALIDNRNTNTSTKVFDESNYVTIYNKTTNNYLYENDGKVNYGAINSQNTLTSQWLIQDFNGHKLIKNRSTGHLMSVQDQQAAILSSSNDMSALGTQWTIEDQLGYKKISSASSHDFIYQDSTPSYAQHGTFNAGTSLWMFTEVPGDITYEAEKAFVSGNVKVSTRAANFSGEGYVDYFSNTSDKVIFATNAQADNNYSAKIHYSNPSSSNKTLSLYVNGLKLQQLTFASTQNSNTWLDLTTTLPLRAGYNSVSLEFDNGDSGQIAIDSLVILNDVNLAYRGATQSYITYEAEQASTNGTIIGPTRAFGEFASEASGRQAVKLTGSNQHVDFNLAKPANSLVLRYSIPDSSNNPDGTTNSILALYVNNQFIKNIDLTSKFAWEYGNYPWSKDPAEGNARRFYDETHVLIDQNLSIGDTISLRKIDTKQDYIIIDFADMEQAPSSYSKPSNFLSILDYGAIANDGADDTPSLEAAITAAKTQHKGVWIPAGTFQVASGSFNVANGSDGLILLDNVTIRGAGMWYTTLKGAKFYGNGSNIRVYDLAIDGDLNIRNDEAHTNGFEGAFGPGSTIQSIWIEHAKTGMWITRVKQDSHVGDSLYTNGLYVAGLRIRNMMADGINFSINTKNSMVEQTNVRYPGDDGLAMWSTLTNGYPNDFTDNNTYRFDTVQLPWLANNMALFGGKNNKATDNVMADTIYGGGGITVATRFDPTPFGGTTEVARNNLIRTGSRDNGLGLNFGAIWVYVDTKPINGNILIKDNIALDNTYQGLSIQGAYSLNKVSFQDFVIDGAGLSGIEMSNGVSGTVNMDNVTVRNTKLGDLTNSTVTIKELNHGFSSNKKTFLVKAGSVTDGPFLIDADLQSKAQLQVNLTDGTNTDVTNGTIFTSQDAEIAEVSSSGVITAKTAGSTIIDVLYGSIHRLYTLEVKRTFVSSTPSDGTTSTPTANPTTSPAVNADLVKQTAVKENGKKLEEAIANKQKIIVFETNGQDEGAGVAFSLEDIQKAMKEAPDTTIVIKSGNATFELPKNLNDIILNSHSTLDLKNSTLTVKIGKVEQTINDQIQKKAASLGFKLLDAPVNYQLTLQSGDKTEEIKNFGSTYVSKTITVDGVIDGNTATAIVFNPETGEFRYVPALFATANGKTTITIKSTTNSIYMVAQFQKTFGDIQTHWAKLEIELLSSKLIINGKTATTFAPNENITRAEFAALLVRSLGLTSNGDSASFKDVAATDWYAKYAQIAAQFKLITGYEDGTFKPNQIITREQMAVMAARALQFSNQKAAQSSSGNTDVKPFGDVNQFSSWAQASIRQIIAAGIMQGKTDVKFAPKDSATRAEATVILARLLQSMQLMNK